MTPLTSSLANLTAARLVEFARQNMPAVPTPSIPTGPSQGDETIKALNLLEWEGYVYGGGIDGRMNGQNPQLLDRFNYLCLCWEKGTPIPGLVTFAGPKDPNKVPGLALPWPAYLWIDTAAFDRYWAMYKENPGEDAPPPFFCKFAPAPPPVVITAQDAPPPLAALTDGPVDLTPIPGNKGVFNSSSTDTLPDGYVYLGTTGVYQKHIYSNPFTANQTRSVWVAYRFAGPALPPTM